ncbi:MgtC/SapB family protein [Pseudomaricurvus hydrocarbonicus]|uniref:MgtC/SapB family protein n=1 Tax=Pseudomaricurvus hydrocarbonicus TaxID=1470433 RepID=UPI001AA0340E
MEFIGEPFVRLLTALLIGGVIGMDRAYRGRAAGFRTHILVCLASCVSMLLMDFQWLTEATENPDVIRMDPARMAQGIMTGIGFLGAGVIMQDRSSVRGLTTAASIWITASIGIVVGTGYYELAVIATLLTLITLAIFNKLVDVLPIRRYAFLMMKFNRGEHWVEQNIRELLSEHEIVVSSLTYKLSDMGQSLAYQMTVRTTDLKRYKAVAEALLDTPAVIEFNLRPLGD